MLTICPKCTLTLAVTAADLRAGQGYVRCGRCANVFNALLGLTEEAEPGGTLRRAAGEPHGAGQDTASATASRPILALPEATGPVTPPPASAPAPSAAIAPTSSAAPTPAAAPAEAALRPPAAPALRLVEGPPRAPAAQLPADMDDEELEVEEFRGTGTFETIVLEGDTFLQTEEAIPEEVLNSELASMSRRIAAAQDGAEAWHGARAQEAELTPELAALREATGEFRHAANLTAPDAGADLLRPAPRPRPGWLAITAAALLVLVLAAQALNHWRDELATRAAWYGPMSRVAALLGEPLHPNWNLAAYDVRQLGASADGGDNRALRVRLSLANVGTRTQGMPLLRVTLLDRYGKAVSSGELAPAQYLPPGLRSRQFLDPDQRIDTEVSVLDPTQQASSFELDVCVAAAGGGLRCAGDAPLVAGTP